MWNRIERVLALGLMGCAAALNLALAPAPVKAASAEAERQIRATLGLPSESALSLEERVPDYRVPFLGAPQAEALIVRRDLVVPDPETGAELGRFAAGFFFSTSGRFLRAESEAKIDDPRRMDVEIVEKGMSGGETEIVGVADVGEAFDFASFWGAVCARLPMNEATEFNLTAVLWKERDADPVPVIILNVWGMDNPLGMRDELPEVLKNRARAVFDLEGNLLWMDNLL
jgi:hypothetical protein